MTKRLKLLWLGSILILLPSVSRADSCAAGSLANVLGTVCTIGPITFDFSHANYTGQDIFSANSTGISYNKALPAGTFTFTPLSVGGRFGFSVGNFLSTSTPLGDPNTYARKFALFSYSLSTTSGLPLITGWSGSGGNLAFSGPGNFSGFNGFMDGSMCGATHIENYGTQYLIGGVSGGTQVFGHATFPGCSFGTSWQFEPTDISVNTGGTITWTGQTTILYDAGPATIPEPGTLLLLTSGLLGLAVTRRSRALR